MLVLVLPCSAGGENYSVSKQLSYFYTHNFGFFNVTPVVKFTVKDFTRTNRMLEVKYDDEYSDGKTPHTIIHLEAFVIPIFTDNQYSICIYSDHALKPSEIHKLEDSVEASMLDKKGKVINQLAVKHKWHG